MLLYLEPLVGLASNQVDRACAAEHNLEGYHKEEHYHTDQKLLINRLNSYTSDGE